MTDLYFYGTLCHAPLLEAVLGRVPDTTPTVLRDYAVYDALDQPFPLIQPEQGGNASGVLVRGLDEGDLARLEYYEGGFGYDLRPVSVLSADGRTYPAQVFLPQVGLWQAGRPWSLDHWIARFGAMSVRAAGEVMAHFGQLSADEIAQRFTGIRIRAAAWVAAQKRAADPDHDVVRDVVVHAHHRRYSNFFAAEEMDLQYRRYDGNLSPILNRGAQMLGQACVVLPYDPVKDAVLLVEQFRTPVFMGGDPAPWIQEPVSGLIDPGETPEETARRETMEEAGLALGALESVGGCYSSTGANSEFVHMFVGLGDFSDCGAGGGLACEGEDIRTEIISYDLLMQGIDAGDYRDMPLVICALWLARHRDRLRADG